MFVSDFVLFPDKFLLPAYKISPFTTADISVDSVGLSRAGTGPRD